jgi:hypothetical protein
MALNFDIDAALSDIKTALQGSNLEGATSRLLDLKDNGHLRRDLCESAILLNGQFEGLRKQQRNGTVGYEDSPPSMATERPLHKPSGPAPPGTMRTIFFQQSV